MKINNKGFSLVELLAVMLILISISLVVVSNITESLVRRDVKECKEQQELAIGVAKIYFSLNNYSSVEIGKLKSEGYFKDDKKINLLKETDVIKLDGDSYKYNDKEVGESCG